MPIVVGLLRWQGGQAKRRDLDLAPASLFLHRRTTLGVESGHFNTDPAPCCRPSDEVVVIGQGDQVCTRSARIDDTSGPVRLLVDLGSMANRDDLQPVLNPPKDDAMIATAEAEAALPFALEW